MNTPATLSVEDARAPASLPYLGRLRSQPRPSVRPRSESVLLEAFASSDAVVANLKPAEPVFCFLPAELRAAARRFVAFPGRVLYAVKCNPHPFVLETLFREGITDFDVASLDEIKLIEGLFEKCRRPVLQQPGQDPPGHPDRQRRARDPFLHGRLHRGSREDPRGGLPRRRSDRRRASGDGRQGCAVYAHYQVRRTAGRSGAHRADDQGAWRKGRRLVPCRLAVPQPEVVQRGDLALRQGHAEGRGSDQRAERGRWLSSALSRRSPARHQRLFRPCHPRSPGHRPPARLHAALRTGPQPRRHGGEGDRPGRGAQRTDRSFSTTASSARFRSWSARRSAGRCV